MTSSSTPLRVFLGAAIVVGLIVLWRANSASLDAASSSSVNGTFPASPSTPKVQAATQSESLSASVERNFGKYLTAASRKALADRVTIPATTPEPELTAYMMFLPVQEGLNISEFNWLIDIAEHHQGEDAKYSAFGHLSDVVRSKPFKKQPERLQAVQDLCTTLLASKEARFRSVGADLVFWTEELRTGPLGSIVREMGTSDPSESVRGSITAKLNQLAALEALKTGTPPKDQHP